MPAIGESEMLLDNLFISIGGVGTAALLCGILAVVGVPAVTMMVRRGGILRRIQRSK